MSDDAPTIQTFAVMFEGFSAAVERFQQASTIAGGSATYAPVFESLNWAVALDDRVRQHWAPEGAVLGWGWRDRVPGGEVVAGVRFARNRIHHQWSDALRLDAGGAQFPIRFPMTFAEWVWRDASQLPEGRPDPDGEARYREQLVGRAARITLAELAETFACLRQVLEPTTLARADGRTGSP